MKCFLRNTAIIVVSAPLKVWLHELQRGIATNIRRNIHVVYEWCRLNLRHQEEGELAASFISDVYALAKHCGYGDLRDELIRDCRHL